MSAACDLSKPMDQWGPEEDAEYFRILEENNTRNAWAEARANDYVDDEDEEGEDCVEDDFDPSDLDMDLAPMHRGVILPPGHPDGDPEFEEVEEHR